jgi:hypothetical protein
MWYIGVHGHVISGCDLNSQLGLANTQANQSHCNVFTSHQKLSSRNKGFNIWRDILSNQAGSIIMPEIRPPSKENNRPVDKDTFVHL